MKKKLDRWNYGVRRMSGGYGPYICDIYFGLKQIDYHTCCVNRKDAVSLGKHWVDWLKKCDTIFLYEPTKYQSWLHWYSIAYAKKLFPSKT